MSKDLEMEFRFLMKLPTKKLYDEKKNKLRKKFPNSKKIISAFDSRKNEFSRHFFLEKGVILFGDFTSNCAEVKNSSLLESRSLPVVAMVSSIILKEAESFSSTLEKCNSWKEPIVPSIQNKIKQLMVEFKSFSVIINSISNEKVSGCATKKHPHRSWKVTLFYSPSSSSSIDCSCKLWDDHRYPCIHAVSLLMAILERKFSKKKTRFDHFDESIWNPLSTVWYSEVYHTSTWVLQYSGIPLCAPPSIDDLQIEDFYPWRRTLKKRKTKKKKVREEKKSRTT